MSLYSDCSICHDIWRLFSEPDTNHKVNLGSFDEALSSPCPRHTPLVKQFRDHCISGGHIREQPNDVGFIKRGSGSSATLTQSLSNLGAYWNLLLVKRDTVPDHPGTGHLLDSDWADLDMAKRWKSECLQSHDEKCQNPLKVWSTQPAWLVDVEKKCIIPGVARVPFVALTYRRGEEIGFFVDDDILGRLQEPGSLEMSEISARLPPVIHRAMHLTSVLGERYLWVDALCIVQGSYTSTEAQLNLMGAIYASALLTIVAADGDSQDALTGLKDVSPPRGLDQRVVPFGDEKIIVRNTYIFSMEGGTPYYNRGWTYQESKLSPRKLLFNKKELHWQCQCSVWHEETTFGAVVDQYIDPRLAVITAGFPDLGALAHMINSYNTCQLRYDEDALPGIFGLLSLASRSFPGGFLYGLPEMFFERALGWAPTWKHTNLRRREPSGRPAGGQLAPALAALPSWSWIGWQGMVGMGYGEAARINSRQYWIEETIPITEWHASSQPSGAPRRRVRSTWYENREGWKDFSRPLPEGWTRHPAPKAGFREEPHLFPDGCKEYIFRHTKMPEKGEHDNEGWFYPFPVADVNEFTKPFMPEQDAYLFCETKGIRLRGFQRKEPSVRDQNLIDLQNAAGEEVGTLHLHNEEQVQQFPRPDKDNTGNEVELVAIYKSRRYTKAWNEQLKRRDLPIEIKNVYVVLWVEWKDGVAYRLASGQIEEKHWDGLDIANVSLTLG
jgi:hypothetical protein